MRNNNNNRIKNYIIKSNSKNLFIYLFIFFSIIIILNFNFIYNNKINNWFKLLHLAYPFCLFPLRSM